MPYVTPRMERWRTFTIVILAKNGDAPRLVPRANMIEGDNGEVKRSERYVFRKLSGALTTIRLVVLVT